MSNPTKPVQPGNAKQFVETKRVHEEIQKGDPQFVSNELIDEIEQFASKEDAKDILGAITITKERIRNPILQQRYESVLESQNGLKVAEEEGHDKEPYCRDFDKTSIGPFDKSFDKTCPTAA